MNASEVMELNPMTLKPDDKIGYATNIIMERRCRSLPVVDEQFCYLGTFGVNCLLKQMIPKAVFVHGLRNVSFIHESFEELFERFAAVKDQPISECMNQEIEPVSPETPLTETMLQLYNTHSSIPVVSPDSCKLLGMISYWDVGEKVLQAGKKKDA